MSHTCLGHSQTATLDIAGVRAAGSGHARVILDLSKTREELCFELKEAWMFSRKLLPQASLHVFVVFSVDRFFLGSIQLPTRGDNAPVGDGADSLQITACDSDEEEA